MFSLSIACLVDMCLISSLSSSHKCLYTFPFFASTAAFINLDFPEVNTMNFPLSPSFLTETTDELLEKCCKVAAWQGVLVKCACLFNRKGWKGTPFPTDFLSPR